MQITSAAAAVVLAILFAAQRRPHRQSRPRRGLSPEERARIDAELDQLIKRAAKTDEEIDDLIERIARRKEELTRLQKRLLRYC